MSTKEVDVNPEANDMDRLLEEAESLSTAIAEDTKIDSTGDVAGAQGAEAEAGEASTDRTQAPDPLGAVQQVERSASELNDLLNDPDAIEPAESTGKDAVEETLVAPDDWEPLESPASDDGEAETDADAAPDDPAATGAEGPDSRVQRKAWPSPADLKRISLSVLRTIVNTPLRIIVILDRPFAEMSMSKKRLLGLVAIATVIGGIAAWVLPSLLDHNPFSDMDAGVSHGS